MHVLELPQSSVAVHVRVIVDSCGHVPPAVTSENVMVGALSHASVAVANPVFAGRVLALHSIVILAGQRIIGGVLSFTTMIWMQVFEFPHPSCAIQVLVMVNNKGHTPATVTSL
jgi:hypothetical protein